MLESRLKKRRIIFRVIPSNRLSYPILLNVWEKNSIDKEFEIIVRDKPGKIQKNDVLVYSFMTPFLPLIHNEIKQIRKHQILIVGGGPHITGDQDLPLQMGFDVLFVGAGEENFLKFGLDLLNNKIKKEKYMYFQKSNFDLNKYFPISKYFKTIPPLEIIRGCSWKCKYCETNLYSNYYRDLNSVKKFLKKLKEKKIKRINFISPSSMEYQSVKGRKININKIEELLNLVKSYNFKYIEYGIFPSEIRPDTVSDEGIKVIKKYVSNNAITIGAQSGSNKRLKELGRGHSVEDIKNAVTITNSCGFRVNLDFIFGYPGESSNERKITIKFIKELYKSYKVKVHIHHFFPLAGSYYKYRLPSFLNDMERENLMELKRSGYATDAWIINENQVIQYLEWVKHNFPKHYSKYY